MLLGKWQEMGGVRKEEKKKMSRVVIYSSSDLCGKRKDKFIKPKKVKSLFLLGLFYCPSLEAKWKKPEIHYVFSGGWNHYAGSPSAGQWKWTFVGRRPTHHAGLPRWVWVVRLDLAGKKQEGVTARRGPVAEDRLASSLMWRVLLSEVNMKSYVVSSIASATWSLCPLGGPKGESRAPRPQPRRPCGRACSPSSHDSDIPSVRNE